MKIAKGKPPKKHTLDRTECLRRHVQHACPEDVERQRKKFLRLYATHFKTGRRFAEYVWKTYVPPTNDPLDAVRYFYNSPLDQWMRLQDMRKESPDDRSNIMALADFDRTLSPFVTVNWWHKPGNPEDIAFLNRYGVHHKFTRAVRKGRMVVLNQARRKAA